MTKTALIDRCQALEAVLAAALFFLLIGLVSGFRPLLAVAAIFMACALLSRSFAFRAGQAWLATARAIGAINNRLLLTLLFYIILTPISLVYRAVRGNILQIRKDAEVVTYFVERQHVISQVDFEKPW
jgi:uncharacterized ion transporter superfamily protein YfcC